jgi:hypothetical protein
VQLDVELCNDAAFLTRDCRSAYGQQLASQLQQEGERSDSDMTRVTACTSKALPMPADFWGLQAEIERQSKFSYVQLDT